MELEKEVKQIRQMLEEILEISQESRSPWRTTKGAAAYLRCSPSKIEALTNLGLLPFYRQDSTAPRSPRLYHVKDLTAYLITGLNPQKHHLSAQERRIVEELL